MKNFKKIFFVLALGSCFLFLNSCHKYPEDPFISLRRPWKRLVGTWQFTGYRINGVDHNHDFDVFLSPKTLLDCNITFSPFYNLKGEYFIRDNNGNNIQNIDGGLNLYGFDPDRKWIYLYISADSSLLYSTLWKGTHTGIGTTSKWKIVELYSHTMILNSNGVDIYFKKQ